MIYFIGNRDIKRVKIGHTIKMKERFISIQMNSPIDLEMLAYCEGGIGKERGLHRKFSQYRKHGEWFELSKEIEEHIEAMKKVNEMIVNDDKIGICQYCKERTTPWQCEYCEEKIYGLCRECHLEIKHHILTTILKKNIAKRSYKDKVDIDSDGSWANVVRASEE